MELKKLQQGNDILTAINTLNQIIMGIATLPGLPHQAKEDIKETVQIHHDNLQKEFDAL